MNAESIRKILKSIPFEPFEVRMSSGEVHRVSHPEFAMVTPGRLVIANPDDDTVAILSLFHITEIRTAQPAS